LPIVGGTLTGPLSLAADATAAMHAVTKQQLDALTARVAAIEATSLWDKP
jgi:hypothetical protein